MRSFTKKAAAAALLALASHPACAQFYTSVVSPIKNILCIIWDSLLYIGLSAAALVCAIAGANYIYNRDNPAGRKASISWIIHAVIGLLILSIAKGLVTITHIPVSCE